MRKQVVFIFLFFAFIFVTACNNDGDDKHNAGNDEAQNTSTDNYSKKKLEGIDFVALGNDPEWELDIDLQKAIWFTTLEENVTALTTPVPQPIKSNDSLTITYEASVEAGSIKIIITREPCINSSTGETFDYNVEVQTSGRVFTGCGKYLN